MTIDFARANRLGRSLRDMLRSLIYPGLDLHVRNRASLRRFWKSGHRNVLDAGSGNGYFSWLAYSSGADVTAMNINAVQIAKARSFLIGYKRADPSRLRFEHRDLYDLSTEQRSFDEIICFETLEHVKGDREVAAQFYRILAPGGFLHLCCPYSRHPRHRREAVDTEERGGHVRSGYTEQDYRDLLEPLGFKIDHLVGIGPLKVYSADAVLRVVRNRFGDLAALPLLPLMLPAVWLARDNPRIPFSLYVRAVKQGGADTNRRLIPGLGTA
ncbi:MAG TPA: class I SAM-dependent methyltransferase [Xanthobacteraceae bacterium]|nr:class I SAM-dependent methyltransferase [Xanthobacteraceae bacterium]